MTDAECVALLRWALPRLGLHWPGFRRVRRRVCKRIARRMRALGLDGAAGYRARLEKHPEEWAWLDATCRIPISRFFRDASFFAALEGRVLPVLAARARAEGRRVVRAWSAGCASGEEPYSLAIVWQRALAADFPELRLELVATDADARLVERARRGCYPASSLRALPPGALESAFEREGVRFRLRPALRAGVTFLCQDVRTERPAGLFDLVLCRNLAFTYFAPALQASVLAGIVATLRAGGALAVGLHETLPEHPALAPWPGARCVYERRAEPAR